MTYPTFRPALRWLAPVLLACATLSAGLTLAQKAAPAAQDAGDKGAINVHFLEVVTPDVKETCAMLAEMHGVTFSEPVVEFGNSRTADLRGGGRISVRAPMHEAEDPVVRPYVLVDDIEAAVKVAEEAGALIAHPPLEIPGQGTFAVYIMGGIQHGLWMN